MSLATRPELLEPAPGVERVLFRTLPTRGPGTLSLLPVRPAGASEPVPHDALLRRARGAAQGLLDEGAVRPGEPFLLVATTEVPTVSAFLGGLLAGALPVPLSPPAGLHGVEGWREHARAVARRLGATRLVAPAWVRELLAGEGAGPPAFDPAELPASGPPRAVSADGPAYVQLTSGSTADPKGVVVSHANLRTNLYAIGWGSAVRPGDVVVSWLPLFHDMGLVGALLFSLYWNLDLALLPPQAFLRRPGRWLQAITDHGGSLSPAPAFAYAFAARRLRDADLAALDLRSWRVAYCGAEPIQPEVLERFAARFAPCGFDPRALLPCYGLAEATLAVTFTPCWRGPRTSAVSRRGLTDGTVAPPDDPQDRLELVHSGRPLPGVEVALRDEAGGTVDGGRTGRIHLRGPTVTAGYLGDAAASEAGRDADGWLDTGDVGCWVDGELAVVGRGKDLIIAYGRNHSPVDIEWAAEEVDGVRGASAAFGAPAAERGTEGAVLVAEVASNESDWSRGAIACALREGIARRTGLRLHDVVLLRPGGVPRTTSGKVQRARLRARYLAGELRS